MISTIKVLMVCIASLIYCQCGGSLHYIVKDTSDYESYLSNVTLKGVDQLRVKQGETTILVPFKTVKSVTLHQGETIIVDRERYCMAEIELHTGEIIGTETTARDKTYLRLAGAVSGKMGKSTIMVDVNRIASIAVEEEQ